MKISHQCSCFLRLLRWSKNLTGQPSTRLVQIMRSCFQKIEKGCGHVCVCLEVANEFWQMAVPPPTSMGGMWGHAIMGLKPSSPWLPIKNCVCLQEKMKRGRGWGWGWWWWWWQRKKEQKEQDGSYLDCLFFRFDRWAGLEPLWA